MKNILKSFLVLTTFLVSNSELNWHKKLDIALQNSLKDNSNVIVMVGEDYCKWCKKMTNDTLSHQLVKDKLSEYTLVYIKRSDKKSIASVPSFDGNIPSFFFMNKDLDIYDSIVGYFTPEDFLSYIEDIEELQ